jgi:hypothetical protein
MDLGELGWEGCEVAQDQSQVADRQTVAFFPQVTPMSIPTSPLLSSPQPVCLKSPVTTPPVLLPQATSICFMCKYPHIYSLRVNKLDTVMHFSKWFGADVVQIHYFFAIGAIIKIGGLAFLFGRSWVQVLTLESGISCEGSRGCPQPLQANAAQDYILPRTNSSSDTSPPATNKFMGPGEMISWPPRLPNLSTLRSLCVYEGCVEWKL